MNETSIMVIVLIVFLILFLILNIFFVIIPVYKIKKRFDSVSINVEKSSDGVENIVNEIQQSKNDICEWIKELHIPPPSFCA